MFEIIQHKQTINILKNTQYRYKIQVLIKYQVQVYVLVQAIVVLRSSMIFRDASRAH